MIKTKERMLSDKKGFLLAEETLKIILAVIAIGFLAFLLFSIYNTGRTSQNLEFAEESVDFLLEEINAERSEVEIFNPDGWWVISWPREGVTPDACSNLGWENCICIVEDLGYFQKFISIFSSEDYELDKLKANSNEGICKENPREFSTEEPIKISDPPITLSIDYDDGLIKGAD